MEESYRVNETLSYVVIVVSELADLMQEDKHKAEEAICRIAQLGRVFGVHLIAATRHIDLATVTGMIRAHLPARMCFRVNHAVESRTILDQTGAENLLNNLDLYFTSGTRSPIRLDGVYFDDQELRKTREPNANMQQPPAEAARASGSEGVSAFDERLPEAIEVVYAKGVYTSALQRTLKVGYKHAARMIDQLESLGIVSRENKFMPEKPREILLAKDLAEALVSRAQTEEPLQIGETPQTDTADVLEAAVELLYQEGSLSASVLQRRLRIGYARAARVLDTLEQHKIISGTNGAASRFARKILVDKARALDILQAIPAD